MAEENVGLKQVCCPPRLSKETERIKEDTEIR